MVHTNWQHCLLLLPLLRRQRDIYWAHEIPPLSRRYGYVFRAIGARVGRVVCVSQAVAERMLSLGMPTSRVVVVRSGIPPAEETGPVGGGERLQLGIVGQIGEWKGHGDLIDALGLLQRDGIRPSLLIFGSGAAEYVASLEERAAELGVQQQIEWCGYVTDKSRIFGAIDVCIVPSRCDEALGMSAIEAGGFGCPVICSSRGGLAASVLNGETGLVIEPERPEQLANAIKVFRTKPRPCQDDGSRRADPCSHRVFEYNGLGTSLFRSWRSSAWTTVYHTRPNTLVDLTAKLGRSRVWTTKRRASVLCLLIPPL